MEKYIEVIKARGLNFTGLVLTPEIVEEMVINGSVDDESYIELGDGAILEDLRYFKGPRFVDYLLYIPTEGGYKLYIDEEDYNNIY